MQIVHAAMKAGEGKKAAEFLKTLGIDIEDYKLIESKTGDLLIINLLYGNTDVLLDNLTSLFDFENDKERNLVIFTPDTVIPHNKQKIKQASFRANRESLITYARVNSEINFKYLMMVFASAIITSFGLLLDNIAVIIGGMVIAPVLGPLMGITIGIVLGKVNLIKQGISAEIMALVIAVFVGFISGYLVPGIQVTDSLQVRMSPTLADLLIAAAAGAAAAYTLIKGEKAALIGVMVAAALLPVMTTVGIGISFADPEMIKGAFLLLGGNFLGLILSNMLVFYFEGLKPQIWYKHKAQKTIKKSLVIIIISAIILIIPLAFLTVYQFYVESPVDIVQNQIEEQLGIAWEYRIESISIRGNLISVYMYAEEGLSQNIMEEIKSEIQQNLDKEYNISFNIIPITEITV